MIGLVKGHLFSLLTEFRPFEFQSQAQSQVMCVTQLRLT